MIIEFCYCNASINSASLGSRQLTGDEGSYLPNYQINLVIALQALSIYFWHFINTIDCHLGRYEPLSPSTKELHGQAIGPMPLDYN